MLTFQCVGSFEIHDVEKASRTVGHADSGLPYSIAVTMSPGVTKSVLYTGPHTLNVSFKPIRKDDQQR